MSYGFTAEGDSNLQRLAEETGGRVEYPLENVYKDVIAYLEKPQDAGNFALTVGTGAYASQMAQGMFRAISNVAGEVTTQYIVRYTADRTAKPNKQSSAISGSKCPPSPGVKIRARKGYFAGAGEGTGDVNIVLISTYELGRQPFGLASPAAWLRERGHHGHCADLAVGSLPLSRGPRSAAGRVLSSDAYGRPARRSRDRAGKAPESFRSSLWCYGLYAPLAEEISGPWSVTLSLEESSKRNSWTSLRACLRASVRLTAVRSS